MTHHLSLASVRSFGARHRLRVTIDKGDDTVIISGVCGSIYEYDDVHLGLMYLSDRGSPRQWTHARKVCLASGMTLMQDGDEEGSFSFDPSHPIQARLAITVAGCKVRQIRSEAQQARLASLKTAGAATRFVTTAA